MGLSYSGSNCFDTANVSGYKRVPLPPASMIPFIFYDLPKLGEPTSVSRQVSSAFRQLWSSIPKVRKIFVVLRVEFGGRRARVGKSAVAIGTTCAARAP